MTRSIDADRIGFFFGAGASIEFGIPSMKQMTTAFANKIRNKGGKNEERQAFNLIHNSLAKAYGKDKVDLEAIISVIADLKEKERLKDNIGELGLFMLERKGIIDIESTFAYKTKTLDKLENKFKKYIRNNVVILNQTKIDLLRKMYSDFFKQLCTVTNCDNANFEDSNTYKYTHSKWTFFTTNYDNAIEDFWIIGRGYPNLCLGFEARGGKKVMYPDRFARNNTSDADPNSAMQLVKLHGSVNWIRNKAGDIEEREYHLNYDEVKRRSGSKDILGDIVIYPLSQKQLYFTPFIQLFRILDAELRKRNIWIIIGYSFRDIIIRTMFERALEENEKRKILVVHPHATEQIKPLFQKEIRDQLICLDRYFAKPNYSQVNRDIAEALLNLG
jgi:SIR2-like domain